MLAVDAWPRTEDAPRSRTTQPIRSRCRGMSMSVPLAGTEPDQTRQRYAASVTFGGER